MSHDFLYRGLQSLFCLPLMGGGVDTDNLSINVVIIEVDLYAVYAVWGYQEGRVRKLAS